MRKSIYDYGDKKQLAFYFSKKRHEKFVDRFPNLMSYFLQTCMNRAIDEKDFVSDVMTGRSVFLKKEC